MATSSPWSILRILLPARHCQVGLAGSPTARAMIEHVLQEIVPPHTDSAFPAMRELRPAFTDRDEFVKHVDELQRPQGYRMIGVLPGDQEDAVAVAGFRVATSLSWGRHVYIDDLSTMPEARGQGLAGQLLAWVHDEAGRLGCREVHLDSGVGSSRSTAHRLYLNSGYTINAHHFYRPV